MLAISRFFAFFLLPFSFLFAGQVSPQLRLDDECVAIAFGPDGRLAYATRRTITSRHFEMQRDDIWLATLDGKKKRIVSGEKIVRSPTPYSYAIQSLRWSPDGTRLTVEMLTRQLLDERGTTEEGLLTLLIDDSGKEIKIQGGDSVIPQGRQALWLADGATVAFLTEAVKAGLLYSIYFVRPASGRAGQLFAKQTFAAVAWHNPPNGPSAAVAIERDASLTGPPRLVWLDLVKESRRELVQLESYLGQLTVSPSGRKVAYFRDLETLEVRDVVQPDQVTRIRIAYGSYQWAPDERRILLKRGGTDVARRSGDLIWVSLPDGKAEPALHSLTLRDFQISPDGRWLAVTEPGKRSLVVYPAQ